MKKIILITILIFAVVLVFVKFGNKKVDLFVDLENPGDCVLARSQCNICSRDENNDGIFICTEAFCLNEMFVCKEY